MNKRYMRKENTGLRKLISDAGMSMAEMMITVAIILVLAGVAFIALTEHQRSLAQLERNDYAKEIFIAAQNHLTMAKGEGYVGMTEDKFGIAANVEKESGVEAGAYYFIVTKGDLLSDEEDSLIDLMLPFGSIEENVRAGGSYIIRYQPATATVLEVFYTSATGNPEAFNYELTEDEFAYYCGLSGEDKKRERRRVTGEEFQKEGWILGWYGDAETLPIGETLKAPLIDVVNDEALYVDIKDNNASNEYAELKLIITGLKSGAKMAFPIRSEKDDELTTISNYTNKRLINVDPDPTAKWNYRFVLDDITTMSGLHFCELNGDNNNKGLVPGEDVKVEAVSYYSTRLGNIAYSDGETENSLYESSADFDSEKNNDKSKAGTQTVFISNFRHLENLDEGVSMTGYAMSTGKGDAADPEPSKKLNIATAMQTKDLVWGKSGSVFGNNVTIYVGTTGTTNYHPVDLKAGLEYDGLRHSVTGVRVTSPDSAESGRSGMFGVVSGGSVIGNLELIDFDITAGTYSGILAGSLHNSNVRNVIAYNKAKKENGNNGDYVNYNNVTVTGDNAGGLIGYVSGGDVRYSGAAVIVSGRSSAGGLIGKAGSTAKVRACFSGGRTNYAEYYVHERKSAKSLEFKKPRKQKDQKDQPIYNVTASSGPAGGLIGDGRNTVIGYCYSTCSASGSKDSNTGGLVGLADGASVYYCYSTGLVSGDYAFVGRNGKADPLDSTSFKNYYYSMINETDVEDREEEGKVTTKNAGTAASRAKPFDKTEYDKNGNITFDYNKFTGGTWNKAKPYDATLKEYYRGEYSLPTVTQLISKSRLRIKNSSYGRGAYFVNTHYGDWPSPETFIINK